MADSKTTGILLFTKISSENNLYLKILTKMMKLLQEYVCWRTRKKKTFFKLDIF